VPKETPRPQLKSRFFTKDNGTRPTIESNGPVKREEQPTREVEVPSPKPKPKPKYTKDLDDLLKDLDDLDILNGDD
jgi:hypothetical protein